MDGRERSRVRAMPTSQNRVWGTQNELWRASRRHVDFMVGSSSRRVTLFPGYVMKELAWAIALVPIIVLLGCGPSTDDIGRTVSLSMQEKFNSDPQFRDLHLTVQSVTVVHSSGNVYQGIAEVSSHGVTHEVMVKITSDGENTMWETEPGALLVFLSDRSSSLPQPYPGQEVSPPVFRPPRESTSVHQVPDYQSMNAAKLSTAVAQRMGFRYTNYPNGYMVDELCSSKMQGFCYPPNWQKWIVDLELKTIGEQADALNAKARHLELIAYFAQAGWPGLPRSPMVEGNRVKAEGYTKGEAQVVLRVGGVVGQRRAHIVHLQQAYSNISGEE